MKKYNWKQWIPLIHVLNTEDDGGQKGRYRRRHPLIHVLNTEDDAATFARFVYPEVL